MPRSAATARALTGVTGVDRIAAEQPFEHGADDERVRRARERAVIADADRFDARAPICPSSEPSLRATLANGCSFWNSSGASDGKLTALRMTPVFR